MRLRTPLTANVLKQLKRIISVGDAECCPEEAMLALGGRCDRSVEALEVNVATVRRWCLCVIGPEAQKQWQVNPVMNEESPPADHTFGRCYLCLEHAIYGACPHVYVGFRLKGTLQDAL